MKTKLISLIIGCVLLMGCSAKWHMNRAVQKDPSLLTIKKDSVARLITLEGKKADFNFSFPAVRDSVFIEKEKIKLKIIRLTDTTAAAEVQCPDTVVTVYDTKEVVVHKIPPSYKAFVKELLDVNNFQFWIIHSILALGVILLVGMKLKSFIL